MGQRLDVRRLLHELGYRQAGFFTARQALEVGYSYQAQKYHVDADNWVRVDRGMFRLRGWPTSVEDDYARWCVWSDGVGVVCGVSAAEVHDLGEVDRRGLDLCLPQPRKAPEGVVIHARHLDPRDVESHGSFRVTTVTRTLLDLATDRVTQEQLDSAVFDATSMGLISRSALLKRARDFGPEATARLEDAVAASPRIS